MSGHYVPPEFNTAKFHCPNCNVYAKQQWAELLPYRAGSSPIENLAGAHCSYCEKWSIWVKEKILHPNSSPAPHPSPSLPLEIVEDYEEARSILSHSPRGASALLRLCIQKLCICLGQPGKSIDNDIKELVKAGLPVRIQQALDTVRVIGNESVHPGIINLNDKPEVALALFKLVNIICEKMISEPKEIDDLYLSLPPDKLKGIAQRDNVKP